MKAVVFDGVGKPLTLVEKDIPSAGPGELILRVKACGICGSDLHGAQTGYYPDGIVMGHEFAGEVSAIGDGVEGWQVGDAALALPGWSCGRCENCQQGKIDQCTDMKSIGIDFSYDGAFAEYVRVQAPFTVKVPEGLGDEIVVLYEPLSTAMGALRKANIQANENILIIGGGPIGLSIAILAKNFGVNFIGLSEMQPERIKRASACGANVVINAAEEKDPVAAFKAITGKDPSVIFECVGLPGMFKRVIDMAPMQSRFIVAGTCMKEEGFTVVDIARKQLQCSFHFGYCREDVEYVITGMAMGRIDPSPMLSRTISLEELPEVFEVLLSPNDECKVVVCP